MKIDTYGLPISIVLSVDGRVQGKASHALSHHCSIHQKSIRVNHGPGSGKKTCLPLVTLRTQIEFNETLLIRAKKQILLYPI